MHPLCLLYEKERTMRGRGSQECFPSNNGSMSITNGQLQKKTIQPTFTSMTCPCCNHRFIDRNANKKSFVFEANDPEQPPWEPEFAMKCKFCKRTLLLYSE